MGVCRYDGSTFKWLREEGLQGPAVLAIFEENSGILWFGTNGTGLFRYDGKTLTNISVENGLGNPEFTRSGKPGPGTMARVWALNGDNNGNLWIGKGDAGAWKYDGRSLVNFTTENGLPGSAIESIYKDKNGKLWFGTDGNGVYVLSGSIFEKFVPFIHQF